MTGFCYFCLCVTAVLALNATESSSARNVSKKLHHRVRDVNRKLHLAEGETPHLPAQRESSWYTCGDGYCRCNGAEAECIDRGSLRYIPHLPPGVTILWVFFMPIPIISDDFFTNVTGLTGLYLKGNGIHSISPGAFGRLKNLTYFNLSDSLIDTHLTADAASVVFNIPTLETLELAGAVNCDKVDDISIKHPMPRLQELNFSFNHFLTINLTWCLFFSGLKRLTINSITTFHGRFVFTTMFNSQSLHNLSFLTYLDLSSSTMSCHELRSVLTIPSLETLSLAGVKGCSAFCDINIQTTVPRLQDLKLSSRPAFEDLNLTCLSPFTGLRRLYLADIDQFTKEHFIVKRVITDYHALHLLPNLTYLDLSDNAVFCDDLPSILTIPSLQELIMQHGTVCDKYKGNISLSLIEVDLSDNSLKYVNFSLPSEAGRSSPLQVLKLGGNQLQSFTPQTCHNKNSSTSMFPSLDTLDISRNTLREFNVKMLEPVCLPSIKSINLGHNALNFRFSSFADDSFGRLETLDVSNQLNPFAFKGIPKDIFRNQHLKTLKLDENDCAFTEFYVDADCFSVCSNLIYLSLDGNGFIGISEERFHQLFGRLVHLTVLSLRSTGISFVTVGMFRGLNSLQTLDLSSNRLAFLPDDVFQFLPNLIIIYISLNKISVVKESTFSLTTRLRLQRIDLGENPFDCSCQVLWFQKWLLTNPTIFLYAFYGYTCGNLPDTTVQSFFMPEQACLLSPETSKFIIATISLIFIGMSLLSFLYRYRWHIRLLLYEAFRAPGDRLQRLRENQFEYDVFVSYDSEDFLWVRDHLMPCLEGRMGLKLCIHQRDFILGCPVVENIMGCVNSSKKMLLLFSKAFVDSQWCQFELQLCLSHAMDTEDALIVVILEDVPPRDLTPAMMAVMKTTTYIEWADDADAVDSFWRRMRLALNEVLQND